MRSQNDNDLQSNEDNPGRVGPNSSLVGTAIFGLVALTALFAFIIWYLS